MRKLLSRIFNRRKKIQVLVVCTANVCRSPLAEGMLNHELQLRGLDHWVAVSSGGTHVGQPGRRPDPRAIEVATSHGFNIRRNKARQVKEEDIEKFHYILGMDQKCTQWLQRQATPDQLARIKLISDWGDNPGTDISDPYYSNREAFHASWQQLTPAVQGLVHHLQRALTTN